MRRFRRVNQVKFLRFTLFWSVLLLPAIAQARPEYALKIGQNRCTQCHYSPAGGGPKNMNGKYYGAGEFKLSAFSKQEYAGADIKGLYYIPERHTSGRGGMGIMAANIYASLPLVPLSSESAEVRLVAEHNLGGFNSGPRHMYVRWMIRDDSAPGWLPQYVVLGRFIPPFGLMFDEHRPYVRIQTNTSWNTGFETGAMLSGNLGDRFHYDLSGVNGQKNQGQLANNQATLWGALANVRFMARSWPVMIGASGSYHEEELNKQPPSAGSVYAMWSLHRSTGNRVPLTLMAEFARAKNWNGSFVQSFVTDSTGYGAQVTNSESQGVLFQANWDLSARLQLVYRYDRLELNRDFPSDAYERHGLGAKYVFGPLMWALVRVESAEAGHPTEAKGTKVGAVGAAWAVLSIGI